MFKKILLCGATACLLLSSAAFASKPACSGVMITSVGKHVCANMTSFNLEIPMGTGSKLGAMHKKMPGEIDAKYEKARIQGKNGTIPHGVEIAIEKVTYRGKQYQCEKAYVKNHDKLYMMNCKWVKK